MKKNKIQTIIISIIGIILIILLIFLILRTSKLKYNIKLITGETLIDITPSESTFDLNQFQDNLIKNIEKNEISIVGIYASKYIEMLNEAGENQETQIESIKTLQGNGIIVSNDGYIITNQHVVSNLKSTYTINLNNEEFNVDKIWHDQGLDIAIVKIKVTKNLTPAKIINITNTTQIGQIVFALKKDPENQETITKMGIINSKNQKFKIDKDNGNNNTYIGLLQTSTAIEPGFSGGPLININGEVIGLNTAIDNIEYGASYSLPLNQEFINQTISSIKESSKIIRPYLGIQYETDTNGIKVTGITKNSPANIAGIEVNDTIYGINNNLINYNNFLYQLYTYKPQKNIILNIQRGDFKQDIQIKLGIKETKTAKIK